MHTDTDRKPNYEPIKELLLNLPKEKFVEAMLGKIAEKLAALPHIALARIWLVCPGDICSECLAREECRDRTKCLHLAASAGCTVQGENVWNRLDGSFMRVPMMTDRNRKPEKVHELMDIDNDPDWLVHRDWAEREKISAYAGQPLLFKGEVFGALAVFSRARLAREEIFWMRMLANQAAAAIAGARADGEIEKLEKRIETDSAWFQEELKETGQFGDIIGQGRAFRRLLRQIELVAPTDASVLILGESGTGKELIAREIHRRSKRSERPMIKVNCPSISRELYESEFFGHVKGSFTGALRDRPGRFEAANGGTLFLDEVGEIPSDLQSKLLRVLQEGEYQRVGEETTRKADVRIIASTNRNLMRDVENGEFRKDLYYRLNVFPIESTPLRERREDIPVLADHFLKEISAKMNCDPPTLTRSNIDELRGYGWPGNIRELRNIIERTVIMFQCGAMNFELSENPGGTCEFPRRHENNGNKTKVLTEEEIRRIERDNIVAALQKCNWKIYGPGGASDLLGLKPTTLTARIKRMGIEKI